MSPTKTLIDRPYATGETKDMSLDNLIDALQKLRTAHHTQNPQAAKTPVPVLCMFLKSLAYHIDNVALEPRPIWPGSKEQQKTVVLYIK